MELIRQVLLVALGLVGVAALVAVVVVVIVLDSALRKIENHPRRDWP